MSASAILPIRITLTLKRGAASPTIEQMRAFGLVMLGITACAPCLVKKVGTKETWRLDPVDLTPTTPESLP